MRRYPGVVTGIVKSLPDREGCIEVEFPWLEEGQRSGRAPVAVPMAGKQRGLYLMPELEDEVLVAFEHGDFDHPFVVGFLWNGVDKPPRTDPALRTFKTVSGHVLEFSDKEGSESISLKWKGGHPSIDLERFKISFKVDDGNLIELTPDGVTIKGTKIKLN